ncbi:unnamed protein product [Ranitomeya imitator]|uniref:Transposase n=1 Tax=Ranitomeya imitator TaxID=111125 RepID=A0ABN9L0R6_9NEOB|nr:unnamed protein product [Ranitomeya imitator]
MESKYRGFTARCKPLISIKIKRLELAFAKKHLNKPAQFWKNILWTDETKINLYQNDGKRKSMAKAWYNAHDPIAYHIICKLHMMGGQWKNARACIVAGKLRLIVPSPLLNIGRVWTTLAYWSSVAAVSSSRHLINCVLDKLGMGNKSENGPTSPRKCLTIKAKTRTQPSCRGRIEAIQVWQQDVLLELVDVRVLVSGSVEVYL